METEEENLRIAQEQAFSAGLTPDGYTPLYLGSTLIGWTASRPVAVKAETGIVIAVMGGRVFDLEGMSLREAFERHRLEENAAGWRIDGYTDIIINLPPDSLDFHRRRTVNYTERSTKTLHSALGNYFRLLEAHIQSEIHKKTPAEVIELILVLDRSCYPWESLFNLSWRGTIMNDLLTRSRVKYFTSYIQHLSEPLITPVGTIGRFAEFLAIQSVEMYNQGGNQLARRLLPQNVFFLQAASEEELTVGESLFNERIMDLFLDEKGYPTNPKFDRVFYFGPANSCLADWIIGEIITVKELHQTALSKGWVSS